MTVIEELLSQARQRGNKKLEEWLSGIQKSAQDLLSVASEKAGREADEIISRARKEAERILGEANKEMEASQKISKPEFPEHHYPLRAGPLEAVAIYCGDHHFREATERFLAEAIPGGNYHPIIIPGGSQMLTFGESLPKFSNTLLRPLNFLKDHATPSRIIFIAHEDCQWYAGFVQRFVTFRGERKDHQVEDLRLAKRVAQEVFPGANVELYYANIASGNQVKFEAIS